MSKTIGFGIIGCGMVSEWHAKAINSLDGAKIIAFSDPVKERAERMASKYCCLYYEDYKEMIKRQDINIVNICTPSALHSRQCIESAKAGKHVIVEKPIDVSLAAADSMINACKDAGVMLTSIFQKRFSNDVIKLKKAVDEGKLGQLNFGASYTKWYRTQEYYDSSEWRGTWKWDGGGALINQSIHYIDLLCYIMGPIDEVFSYCATRAHQRIEVEDVAAASVKFKSGSIGLIEGNTAAFPGFSSRLDINGSDGSVIIQDERIVDWQLKCEGAKALSDYGNANIPTNNCKPQSTANEQQDEHSGHALQIQAFMSAITNNADSPVGADDGRYILAVITALYESAKTGKPVKVLDSQ